MYKKYLPLIAVLAAATLLWFIKSKQRGSYPKSDTITIPANVPEGFDRHTTHLIYTKHAKCRMDCRHIDESEVVEILDKGTINYDKIEKDEAYKLDTYFNYTSDELTMINEELRIKKLGLIKEYAEKHKNKFIFPLFV